MDHCAHLLIPASDFWFYRKREPTRWLSLRICHGFENITDPFELLPPKARPQCVTEAKVQNGIRYTSPRRSHGWGTPYLVDMLA